ncbi:MULTISPECIES: hypothetical protein [unclassified Neisseria]|uniref:hypothetical protein n=1 Tax=unclassified Neisseria TaxID=2623750 RepID=UPI001072B9CA|nr:MULTISPECIES: hypothetical protein [unclassified Neisseria]MBF0803856.1 hypothetical protein [Neisseria sp. 19428wB4_WF04]TFU43449.1 hypothetical protein E4T99_05720 [Neisseria sp. WF04]
MNIDKQLNKFSIKGEKDTEGHIILDVVYTFESCMKNKEYELLNYGICGTQVPKWNKGKCNL